MVTPRYSEIDANDWLTYAISSFVMSIDSLTNRIRIGRQKRGDDGWPARTPQNFRQLKSAL